MADTFYGRKNMSNIDMSTDLAWEEWGRREPYFGVITDSKFRSSEMTEQTKREFFESGRWHVNYIMQFIHKCVDANFEPKRVLDFGCGVGRLLIPFAGVAKQVFGLDVSPSMLLEAKRNCEAHGVTNAHFLRSDDTLSSLIGGFDLIHSCIVFQHIPVARGRSIFSRLLHHLRPGGIGAVQFTYSKAHYAATHGIAPIDLQPVHASEHPAPANVDPEIQMNPYNMNSILFMLQENRVTRFYTEFTDHGGELGVFLFFRKPL
jgi:2-polyprenyl-3-methyl-5-hydroxy-6-metoxy-1,4-benzoquinol methylase